MHPHLAHELLTQKVADLDEGAALRDGAVDREMGVYGSHLVLVALFEDEHALRYSTSHRSTLLQSLIHLAIKQHRVILNSWQK